MFALASNHLIARLLRDARALVLARAPPIGWRACRRRHHHHLCSSSGSGSVVVVVVVVVVFRGHGRGAGLGLTEGVEQGLVLVGGELARLAVVLDVDAADPGLAARLLAHGALALPPRALHRVPVVDLVDAHLHQALRDTAVVPVPHAAPALLLHDLPDLLVPAPLVLLDCRF